MLDAINRGRAGVQEVSEGLVLPHVRTLLHVHVSG